MNRKRILIIIPSISIITSAIITVAYYYGLDFYIDQAVKQMEPSEFLDEHSLMFRILDLEWLIYLVSLLFINIFLVRIFTVAENGNRMRFTIQAILISVGLSILIAIIVFIGYVIDIVFGGKFGG